VVTLASLMVSQMAARSEALSGMAAYHSALQEPGHREPGIDGGYRIHIFLK